MSYTVRWLVRTDIPALRELCGEATDNICEATTHHHWCLTGCFDTHGKLVGATVYNSTAFRVFVGQAFGNVAPIYQVWQRDGREVFLAQPLTQKESQTCEPISAG